MLDEVEDPNLHQWRCICRLLMFHNPTHGAEAAEWFDRSEPPDAGWNRIRNPLKDYDTFILVDPNARRGETRFTPPGDVDRKCRRFVELQTTKVWSIARRLADVLDGRSVLDGIERANLTSLDAYDAAVRRRLSLIQAGTADLGNKWFCWGPREVVDAYLRFEIPGVIAAQCLGSLLVATIEFLAERASVSGVVPVVRASVAAYFADAAYRLVRRRRRSNVRGYFDLSYLASLFSDTAGVVGRGVDRLLDSDESVDFNKMLLNAEERACDQLNPLLFALPARFSTVGVFLVLSKYCRLAGTTMSNAASVHRIHPALTAACVAELEVTANDDIASMAKNHEQLAALQERLHARFIAESRGLDGFDMSDLKGEGFSPIPAMLDELLTERIDLMRVREAFEACKFGKT